MIFPPKLAIQDLLEVKIGQIEMTEMKWGLQKIALSIW